MVVINYNSREVSCKIVYYGPGLSGKTTNLQYVHSKVPGKTKGDLISLATDADRTLYFDFLPINIGDINGFTTKFQLYTVPGQVFYNATRKLVLRGVDGIVFVADSQAAKADENVESLDNLKENLAEYGLNLAALPLVLQYNKRDLPGAMTVEELNKLLNERSWPVFEACASKGTGVFDTLKYVIKLVLDRAKKSSKTLQQQDMQRVEDAQLPPEETVPLSQAAEPEPEAAEPVGVVADQHQEAVVSSREEQPAAPVCEPEAVGSYESGILQVDDNVDLTARTEPTASPVDAPPVTVKAVSETAGNTVGGAFETAGAQEGQTEPASSTSCKIAATQPDYAGLKRIEVVNEDEIDSEGGSKSEADVSESDEPSDDADSATAATDSEEKLYQRLPNIVESEEGDISTSETEPLEREAFAVPTMQGPLRRKAGKKKRGFFLFRWLFRKG